MKKLCTYLTLFVLGLLALAQPVVAADLVKGQKYYIDASGFTGSLGTIKIWAGTGVGVTTDITATTVADKIYSWTQPADQTGFTLWVKNDNSEFAFGSSAIGNNNCIKITGSTWNSAAAQWTTYTPGGGGDSTDYTFYVDASALKWTEVYAWLYEGDSTWKGISSGAKKTVSSTALGNGIFKFEVAGVVESGKAVFKDEADNTWSGDAHKAKWEPKIQNGYIYRITSTSATTGTEELYIVKPVVTATPATCTFYGSQEVTLSADKKGSKIYYTTDGTEPSESNGTVYSASLSFTETTTLKAVAILDGVSSEVLTATYTKGTPEVLIQPSSTTFETTLEVTITATPSDAKIYYTTDGTEPSTDGTSYDSPVKFTISSTTTVKAIAVINGVQSEKKEGVFKKTAKKLYIRGTFTGTNEAWGKNEDVEFPYDEASGLYTYTASKSGGFMISTTTGGDTFWNGRFKGANSEKRLNVPTSKPTSANIATNGSDGYDLYIGNAGTIYFDYAEMKIWYEPATTQKPVLTANPAGGEFETSVSVTLSATPACDIYYTTNGTEPSAASSKYSSPLSFTATTTLKAVAILNGESSDVITYTYTKKEEGVYSGSLYAKGPACNNDWNTWAQLSGTDGVFSFDIIDQGEFLVCGSTNDNDIYCIDGSVTYPFVIPQGEAAAAKIKKKEGAIPGNFKAPAANGKVFIDMNDHKIWYEPKSFSDTKLYIRAAFISDNNWGAVEWNKEMTWNESEGVYVWDATSASAGDNFMISWNKDMWNHKFACSSIPTEKPSTENVNEDKGSNAPNLILPKPGYIKYDPVNKILWVGPKQAVPPTLYTFYVKIDESYASAWGEDKCYLYTFDEGDDKWTSINGQCVKYDRRLADGVYKFVVRGQSSKGRMLFKNTWGTSKEEYSGTILPADIKPGALYTISAKGEFTVAPEEYVESKVFEAGKAYYVDASAVAKDGTNWFENADCTLGVEYDGHVHFGGTIVKVSSDPLVYRFTVNEDQTEIVVGRRNDQGLHDAVTVQAPTDGSNCIFLDGSSDELVLDHLGTYSPASGLYILGSSDAIEGDWKNATPIAMNYDATKDVFYYMVQGTNASADHPIEFLISRGASNADFFKAENAFMPVHDGYIHMAEPSYMKGKPGYTDGNYFKLISRGRVMAKYIKAENSEEITGLKIWYEPVVWPDLYALGSIIADPDDTKDIQSTHEQWHTFVKLEKDEKQPGLYYYDLGRNGNEHLFNEKPYPVTGGVFGDIDEHGHFNFSFLSDTDTGEFWKDAFVPAVGQGMGTLNRDGVPVPFQYRDSKPDQTEWVSTNFVFGERSRIWVDVVRQLVWIETFTELSGNQVVFDFWDKGGDPYPKADGYQWWTSNDKSTYKIQAFIKNADETKIPTESPYTFQFTDEHNDLNWQASEAIDNVGSGVRYHFVAELPKSFYELDSEGNATDKVIDGGYLWIRITDVNNAKHVIERPYAYQATYTQGPKGSDESINYNYYGNILAAGDPIVTIEPSVNMIYADVEAPEHLGLFRESHIMHYPYVNQYSTAVTVNPGNVYPFYVDGLTKPAKNESGETIADQYVPVDGAPVVFEKSNQVTVSYGSIRETKYGTTGMAVIKGIDHANAAATDKMEVTVTYTSPGLIFARTKTEPLKIDANELPTMQNSQDNQLDVAAFYSGTACNQGLTVDLILHQKFEFRDIMTQGRAAYIGYEVKIDNPNDHSHVAEGHEHMAKNGVPLMWDFKDDKKRDIKGFTDLDKWHYEAFTGKSMAIQLHHVLCGKTKADLEGKTVTGSVTFHLYVPVATEFAFETGTTSLVRGMHKAGEQVNSSVLGDPNHPYTGSVSAKSYDTLKHNIDFSFGVGNITTGVEGVGVEDAPVEFYNLQGVRMTSDALAPGIYIRRQGNETSKVYIR